jgi:tRNA(adenine34) deaminase
MDLALKTAENAGKAGEVPIGCVIVRDYEVIATCRQPTLTDRDPEPPMRSLSEPAGAAETIGTERLIDCESLRDAGACTNVRRPRSRLQD